MFFTIKNCILSLQLSQLSRAGALNNGVTVSNKGNVTLFQNPCFCFSRATAMTKPQAQFFFFFFPTSAFFLCVNMEGLDVLQIRLFRLFIGSLHHLSHSAAQQFNSLTFMLIYSRNRTENMKLQFLSSLNYIHN